MLFGFLMAFVPIIVIYAAMPYIARKDNFFGISAPESFYGDKRAKKMRKAYTATVSVTGFLFLAAAYFGYGLFDGDAQMTALTVLLFAMLFVMGCIYLIARKKASRIKQELNWSEKAIPTAVADTGFSSRKTSASKLWFVIYAVIIIVTVTLGLCLYSSLPDEIAVHTDASGVVTYEGKSLMTVIYMPIAQLIITLIYILVYYSIKKARPELSAEEVEASAQKNAKHRYAWSLFLMISGLLLLLLFLLVQLEMLGIIKGIAFIGSMVLLFSMVVGAVVLALVFGQSGSKVKSTFQTKEGTVLNRDDDRYWKMGMFYVNRNDPSLFVEKRFGVGFTFNFGRPMGWILLAAIAIAIIGSIIISK